MRDRHLNEEGWTAEGEGAVAAKVEGGVDGQHPKNPGPQFRPSVRIENRSRREEDEVQSLDSGGCIACKFFSKTTSAA